jgi:hypothetical protein
MIDGSAARPGRYTMIFLAFDKASSGISLPKNRNQHHCNLRCCEPVCFAQRIKIGFRMNACRISRSDHASRMADVVSTTTSVRFCQQQHFAVTAR